MFSYFENLGTGFSVCAYFQKNIVILNRACDRYYYKHRPVLYVKS